MSARFLRKSALDELPQLLNIVRGEMGLVGPRPLVVEEDRQIEGWHRRRLELTPGMTGPWQILGPSRSPLREMAVMDYLYVANWSLWSDIKILLRTVSHVARTPRAVVTPRVSAIGEGVVSEGLGYERKVVFVVEVAGVVA